MVGVDRGLRAIGIEVELHVPVSPDSEGGSAKQGRSISISLIPVLIASTAGTNMLDPLIRCIRFLSVVASTQLPVSLFPPGSEEGFDR